MKAQYLLARRVLCLLTTLVVFFVSVSALSAQPAKATASAAPPPAASAAPSPAQGTHLKIYTKPVEPFAYQQEGKAVGFSIDLWDRLAKEAGFTYEIHWVTTVNELIEALKNKEADGAIAAISITAEREKVVDFSQPFYESGLGILVGATQQSSLMALFKGFFTADFLKLCGVLLVLLFFTAHILWFFERKKNPDQFPKPYWSGVWESSWWAISTILSGGCDNKGPVVIGGRIIGSFWMLTSIILVAYFTASATTIMTVNQLTGDINGPADLPGKVVATVKGSTAEKYLVDHRVQVRPFPTIDDAYAALDKKQVKAVVYDAPILLFHAKGSADQRVVGRIFQKQNYGIALQRDSKLRKPINEALLRLRESGNIDELQTKWFGPSD